MRYEHDVMLFCIQETHLTLYMDFKKRLLLLPLCPSSSWKEEGGGGEGVRCTFGVQEGGGGCRCQMCVEN